MVDEEPGAELVRVRNYLAEGQKWMATAESFDQDDPGPIFSASMACMYFAAALAGL